jgi:hypothetical protein
MQVVHEARKDDTQTQIWASGEGLHNRICDCPLVNVDHVFSN